MQYSDPSILPASDEEWRAEIVRREYLSHLGFTPLLSRYDPPGAAAAHRLTAPTYRDTVLKNQEAAAESGSRQMGTSSQRPQLNTGMGVGMSHPGLPTEQSARSKLGGNAKSQTDVSSLATRSLAVDHPTASEPVSLVMVTSADVLWIEVLEDQLLRREQLQLIAAMARAVRGTKVHCAHQQFDWPPAHQSALSNAKGGMADMLKGFIQRLIRDHATQQIVLMGTCDCLPDTGLSMLEVPSSVSMLRDGSLKQQAWDVLKPLRARA